MRFFDTSSPRFPLSSIGEYRLLAKKRLPRLLFDYIDGGAFNEVTMQRNRGDYEAIQLRKHVLRDVSTIETKTEILGQKLSLPLVLAPVGFAGIYARRGEVQAACAAEKAGIPFSLSTLGICSIEEVRKATLSPFWYQFYMMKEKRDALELLKRAEAASCPILILTVDLPVMGVQARHQRKRNQIPFYDLCLHTRWFIDVYCRGKPLTLGNLPQSAPPLLDLASMRKWMGNQLNPSFNWQDLEWIRTHWRGKIILKGILDPEDARMAAEIGIDGIVVSNHGGRHFDSLPSTISMLPFIADAVENRLDILIDGGITSGLDIIKAIALGAKACMIGRSWAFALAARGEQGVSEIIGILHRELKLAMAHMGVINLGQIDRHMVYSY